MKISKAQFQAFLDVVPSEAWAVIYSGIKDPNAKVAMRGVLFDDGSHLWHANGDGAFTRLPDTIVTKNLAGLGPVMVAIRVAHGSDITLATSTDGIHWTDATIG